MTDKIAIERKILEHTVIALEYAYGADDVLIAESIRFLRHALAQKTEPPSMQPLPNHDNHHNALKCPYCNPRGLVFAEPPAQPALSQKDKEQSAFEDWLVSECPSGDVESVQHQWLASSEYLDLQDDPPAQPAAQPVQRLSDARIAKVWDGAAVGNYFA